MLRLPNDVLTHLEGGGALLVPSHQRAHAARLAYAAGRLEAGARVWASPDVMTDAAWVRRECTQRAVDLFKETESRVQLGVALRSLGEVTAAGSAGGAGHREATEHLKQSIAIFEEVGNEVELARSCRAYAELLRQTPEHSHNPAIASEASLLSRRAEEIFAKMRASAGGLGGEALFAR